MEQLNPVLIFLTVLQGAMTFVSSIASTTFYIFGTAAFVKFVFKK